MERYYGDRQNLCSDPAAEYDLVWEAFVPMDPMLPYSGQTAGQARGAGERTNHTQWSDSERLLLLLFFSFRFHRPERLIYCLETIK